LIAVLDFLEDGVRIEIHDADDHTVLNPIEIEGPHFFFHVGDDISLFVLQSQSNIRRFRSISLLDVFLKGQNGALRVNSEFRNLE